VSTVTATHVAVLRGINVGGHNKVPMAELRALLTGLGYTDVRTHLQSGNVVFRAPGTAVPGELGAAIADGIVAELGVSVAVLVRTAAELRDVVAANPLPTHEPARLLVLFLDPAIDPAGLAVDRERYAPEQFAVRPGEIYLYCANGILESALVKEFSDRRLGCAVTARNWNTVTRLAELLDR
jgi:uncharacterized protein (DUF1697 family)